MQNNQKKTEKYQKQKIYIKNILPTTSPENLEKNLIKIFQNFGEIIDTKILQNTFQKWYAFITFKNDQAVQKILSTKILFQNKLLKITRAKNPKKKKQKQNFLKNSKKLFLGGIPCQVSKNEIFTYFSKFGKIVDLCLPLKDRKNGVNKGYGFVTFENSDSAEVVVRNFEEHFLRGKWIEIKIAKPRGNLSPNFNAYLKKEKGEVLEDFEGLGKFGGLGNLGVGEHFENQGIGESKFGNGFGKRFKKENYRNFEKNFKKENYYNFGNVKDFKRDRFYCESEDSEEDLKNFGYNNYNYCENFGNQKIECKKKFRNLNLKFENNSKNLSSENHTSFNYLEIKEKDFNSELIDSYLENSIDNRTSFSLDTSNYLKIKTNLKSKNSKKIYDIKNIHKRKNKNENKKLHLLKQENNLENKKNSINQFFTKNKNSKKQENIINKKKNSINQVHLMNKKTNCEIKHKKKKTSFEKKNNFYNKKKINLSKTNKILNKNKIFEKQEKFLKKQKKISSKNQKNISSKNIKFENQILKKKSIFKKNDQNYEIICDDEFYE